MVSLAILSIAAGTGAVVAGTAIRRRLKASRKRRRGRALDRELAAAVRSGHTKAHLPEIETRMAESAFGPIRKAYAPAFGEIFAGFSIFRIGATIRMELSTRKEWLLVTPLYKGMALRHLWQRLRDITRSNDVTIVIDAGSALEATWNEANVNAFKDRGVTAPWANGGTVGTLLSGSLPARLQNA